MAQLTSMANPQTAAFVALTGNRPAIRTSAMRAPPATSNVETMANGTEETQNVGALRHQLSLSFAGVACGVTGLAGAARLRRRRASLAAAGARTVRMPGASAPQFASSAQRNKTHSKTQMRAAMEADLLQQVAGIFDAVSYPDALQAAVQQVATELEELATLLGPPQAAAAFDAGESVNNVWSSISGFFFNPRLQYDAQGNPLIEPNGNPLPDNLWTQYVAVQATLIQNLDKTIAGLGVPGSFGLAVATYTLLIRALLYPFVKGQLETTAKIQVLAPRVNELKEKYKDNEERLQQEVGLLYMDLQIDPLGAIVPLLLQLPVFWGLYRGIRRLAIVQYDHLKEGFLWIPSLYGPNMKADPSFDWLLNWQGPLINLHPKLMGWEEFGLYAVLPLAVFFSYKQVLSEATEDKESPKILQFFPYMLAFIASELPQAIGIYFATNIASSVALTSYTKNQIASKIPGYDEFVKTGKWPPGVDPEKVLAKAFGVQRLSADGAADLEDPLSVPEAVFSGRADHIPELIKQGKSIDQYDERGIAASAYCIALNNPELLERLFELGADPKGLDKQGNSLLHYCAGYGRPKFLSLLLDQEGAQEMLSHANKDGQTALDVARMNLTQQKIADAVRPVIGLLEEAGAVGKATTKEDEAKFEEMREKRIQEESVQAARSALMALAEQSAKASAAKEQASEAEVEVKEATVEAPQGEEEQASESSRGAPKFIADSLDRVKKMDLETLKQRLGANMSEEKLEKISKKLEAMTPEQLAVFAATGKIVSVEEAAAAAGHEESDTEQREQTPAPPAPVKEEKKVSILVD